MLYFAKTPNIIKRIFPKLIWDIPSEKKVIYLTFDDGPAEDITNWVLSELDKYNAKATFFCIGKNVMHHPSIFKDIIKKGHAIGNHTHNHLNGWQKSSKIYLQNIDKAQEVIDREIENYERSILESKIAYQNPLIENRKSKIVNFFRPPYGKIHTSVAKKLLEKNYQIIMWDVLSGDFDLSIPKEKCLENVINNTRKGSIVVFHDSVKASKNLKFVLPIVLDQFSKKGYVFESIA